MTFTITNLPDGVYDRIRQLADESHKPLDEAVVNALTAGTNDLLLDSDARAIEAAMEKIRRDNSRTVPVRDMSDLPRLPASLTIDLDNIGDEGIAPHIIPEFDFPDPPGNRVIPTEGGRLPADLCCQLEVADQ